MLNNNKFKSVFNNELYYFIKYKRSLGLKYEQEVNRLKKLDLILFNLKLKSKKIDKKTFDKLTERNNKNDSNYSRQYGITKDFCKYLINSGYKNIYYEERKIKVINNYKPILFNDEEIILLFEIMDSYVNDSKNKWYYKSYYTYSILFRLIYSCGLRISEAINISINNVNLQSNIINIVNSKNTVSRIVVLSESMKQCLIEYIDKFDINNGYLFPNYKNTKINDYTLEQFYKKILNIACLNSNAHVHDLRHVFTNHALNQMLEKGYSENVVIVYLSKFLGHKSIYETEYYLHLTDFNKKKIIDNNDSFSKNLYEGVDFDE